MDLTWIFLLPPALIGAFLLTGLRILLEYQRAVVFRLGRFKGVSGPGVIFFIPIAEEIRTVDMRIRTVDIPRQEVMTKDNISVLVNAVVYYRVERAEDAIIKIENFEYAVRQYTQTALRDVIGNSELDMVLTEREKIAGNIREIVDAETSGWGIDITSIKMQEIELPAEMKRAIAKQAEAERERRAMIIAAEGELTSSEDLKKAAQNLAQSPIAVQLRTLQTIRDIAADPSEKIVLFLPSDIKEILKKFTTE